MEAQNIKKAVCCSEVIPGKGSREEKENADDGGWKDFEVLFYDGETVPAQVFLSKMHKCSRSELNSSQRR